MPQLILDRTEQLEVWLHIFVDLTHGCHIAAPVAVVWRTPDGNHILTLEVIFVALVDQLVSSGNKIKTIDMAELLADSVSK